MSETSAPCGSEAVPVRRRPILGPVMDHALRDVLATAAVLGGLLYGLIALAYDRFYEPFGLSPGDVGITQQAVIARTAVGLALFVAVLAGVYAAAFLLMALILRRNTMTTVALLAAAFCAVLGPVVVGLTIAPVILAPGLWQVVVATVTLFLLALLTTWRSLRPTAPYRYAVAMWVVWVCSAYLLGVTFAERRTTELVEAVLAGHPVSAEITFIFDVRAHPVCIHRDGDQSEAPVYGLYLGASDGRVAIYEPEKRRTLVESSGAVHMELIPHMRGAQLACEAP